MTEEPLTCALYYPSTVDGRDRIFYISSVEIDLHGCVTRVTGTPLLRLSLRLTYDEALLLLGIIPSGDKLEMRWL